MKLNQDDPRLTAYALDELPANERAEIEAELKDNAECRQIVEEIRGAAKLLSENFAKEPQLTLLPEQHETIEEKLQPSNIVRLPCQKIYWAAGLAAAACVVFVVVLQTGVLSTAKSNRKMASANVQKAPVQREQPQPVFRPVQTLPPALESERPANTVVRIEPPTTAAPFVMLNQQPAPAPAIAPAQDSPVMFKNIGAEVPPLDKTKQDANGAWAVNDETSYLKGPAPKEEQKLQLAANAAPKPEMNYEVGNEPRYQLHDVLSTAPNVSVSGGASGGGGFGGGGRGGSGGGQPVAGSGARGRSVATRPINSFAGSARESEVVDSPHNDKSLYLQFANPEPRDEFVPDRFYRVPVEPGTANYPHLQENSFLTALNHPLSTFSIDVDTASYANVRRFLNEGRMPPRDAVRVEEMINYFKYNYPPPRGDDPFFASIEVAGCPWDSGHRLVRIGIKGREIARDKRPPSNFVFLIDVSGSMGPRERLPLIKQALRQLVKKMNDNDRVAIVTYASQAVVRLQSTPCSRKEKILQAIDELEAGGSTNGGEGIQQAYRVAQENLIEGGVNRVLLATDGDFNVGMTDQNQLVRMIQDKAKSGVFLTTLGVGTDNYKDALMQKLADKGNGNYFYLDTLEEAQKVLVDQMSGTLVTIAKDVKIQIEFNPAQVNGYRLIGYEKRLLRKEDFNNDAKDAGEIGAGHTVTALYEVVPAGAEFRDGDGAVDDLKYQKNPESTVRSPQSDEDRAERYVARQSKELLTLKLRYKQPDGDRSRLLEFPVTDGRKSFERASTDFKFAAAVAEFGMLLRDSEYKGNASYGAVLELARDAKGADEDGYRSEFLTLARKAREIAR
jgi:Ca-activated chloride channel family protein